MKDFITGVLATIAIIILCSCTESEWTPIQKTGGEGTQEIGESDLVLPGGGMEVSTVPELPVYTMTENSGMSDAEKLELIDEVLTDAVEYFWDVDDTQVWKGVAVVISNIIEFGGIPVG